MSPSEYLRPGTRRCLRQLAQAPFSKFDKEAYPASQHQESQRLDRSLAGTPLGTFQKLHTQMGIYSSVCRVPPSLFTLSLAHHLRFVHRLLKLSDEFFHVGYTLSDLCHPRFAGAFLIS